MATETGTMAFSRQWRCLSFSFRQRDGHSCLASETVHASHLQQTTRGHFDQNMLESTEVSAVPAEVVDAKTGVEEPLVVHGVNVPPLSVRVR